MGITWRFIMPLLSTLAALVIIVHSAEEDINRDHRFELRPRALDRAMDTEQPWREMRAEPMIPQTIPSESWNHAPEDEPPIRRRVGRKRKRRPPSPPSDETDNPPAVNDENLEVEETKNHDTDKPARRRKKHRLNRWTDESTETTRPVRRRGQRRKRPSLDTWPEISEFGGFPRNKKVLEPNRETIIQTDLDDDEVVNQRQSYRDFDDDDDEDEQGIRVLKRPTSEPRFVISDENKNRYNRLKEDKSLSEFSVEVMAPVETNNNNNDEYDFFELRDKMKEKSPKIFENVDKAKEQGPIDASTLKDILKRSNGTSLSEILQQHNLTLDDLLNGKENAIAVLKAEKALRDSETTTTLVETSSKANKKRKTDIKDDITTAVPTKKETEPETKEKITSVIQNTREDSSYISRDNQLEKTILNASSQVQDMSEPSHKDDFISISQGNISTSPIISEEMPIRNSTIPKMEQRKSGMAAQRRFPGTIRRKLRMRPTVNNTYKSQINRDLMALSARRYVHHNRRNATKARQWREMIPLMVAVNETDDTKDFKENRLFTTTSEPEETTTVADIDEKIVTTISDEPIVMNNVSSDAITESNPETTTIMVEILATELDVSVTEKPIVTRPSVNLSGQRRQSLNSRIKKKRLKQRTSTTEAPQDDIMKHLLELGNLVSSSEFIARTQLPKLSPDDYAETATELEDFMTTQAISRNSQRPFRPSSTRKSGKLTTVTKSPLLSSTEETAKIEIEEILNDTRTSAKLSKILKDRNMTLTELLEHRARGSSHVHLADIFHNASREPNPPEPFLTKSLIEPISKETYPLRALLDANSHDPPAKATTVDSVLTNHVNIPVIMNFGNNVNENAENMGIMSLFNNFTMKTTILKDNKAEKSTLQQDSKGTPYKSTVITVNATDDEETTRESRMMDEEQDMISWNEIFSMIRKNHKNETKDLKKLTNEISPSRTQKKIALEEDVDGDGVIVLEDLQHLKDSSSNDASGSEEKIQFNTLERAEILQTGILNKPHNSAKSVTVATASIVGLAMILFLLTYAALKWRQQRSITHKKKFCDDKIPTPVFENRKVTKNCSSRSISPMLPTSNIYTMSTLDSQNGKDSPEYMWDTLRKPFQ